MFARHHHHHPVSVCKVRSLRQFPVFFGYSPHPIKGPNQFRWRTCTRIRSAGKDWLIFLILYSVKFVEIVIVGLAALQPSEDVE